MVSAKPIVIVGEQRSGSSWVYHYAKEYNKKFNYIILKDINGHDEFFNPVCKNFIVNSEFYRFTTIDQKISFLNQTKHSHKFSFKIMVHHVINNLNWFSNFFKNTHVIYTTRKSLWEQFLSWIIQQHNNWNHLEYYNNKFVADLKYVDIWMARKQKIITFDHYDETWIYENLTTNFLNNYFNLEIDLVFDEKKVQTRRKNYQNNIINYNELYSYFLDKEQLLLYNKK